MKKKIQSDEIDLIGVIINIWKNKLKIVAIAVGFIVLSAVLHFVIKPPLNAKTEILPITIFENNLYLAYNSLLTLQSESNDEKILTQQKLNRIDRNYLLNLFLEELQIKEIVTEAIKKFKLINQNKFNDKDEYLEEVEKYALKLDLLRPINVDGSQRGETRLNWTIEFEIKDKEKWEDALSFINNKINKDIQNYLVINFNTSLNNLRLLDQFKLEDLNQKIEFAKKDYDIETNNRLAFLYEQASIARELNIKNNTLEVENFNTSSGGVISNLQTAKPYYMRGYSMIEKEIELIESRNNKDAFIKNLLDLEKDRRNLLENKSLERIEQLFNSTPIINGNNFKAAEIIYKDTEFESSFSLTKAVLFSGIFGIIFGIFYVLISNAIQQRK
jgi:LPS O-antigen subunit length determinant protein (WzzB/FepE family)